MFRHFFSPETGRVSTRRNPGGPYSGRGKFYSTNTLFTRHTFLGNLATFHTRGWAQLVYPRGNIALGRAENICAQEYFFPPKNNCGWPHPCGIYPLGNRVIYFTASGPLVLYSRHRGKTKGRGSTRGYTPWGQWGLRGLSPPTGGGAALICVNPQLGPIRWLKKARCVGFFVFCPSCLHLPGASNDSRLRNVQHART